MEADSHTVTVGGALSGGEKERARAHAEVILVIASTSPWEMRAECHTHRISGVLSFLPAVITITVCSSAIWLLSNRLLVGAWA